MLNLFNFAVIVSRTTVFQLSFLIILVWLVSTFKWTLKSDRKDQILTILSLPYSPFFNFFCCLNDNFSTLQSIGHKNAANGPFGLRLRFLRPHFITRPKTSDYRPDRSKAALF